jgi:hypothetical protein
MNRNTGRERALIPVGNGTRFQSHLRLHLADHDAELPFGESSKPMRAEKQMTNWMYTETNLEPMEMPVEGVMRVVDADVAGRAAAQVKLVMTE